MATSTNPDIKQRTRAIRDGLITARRNAFATTRTIDTALAELSASLTLAKDEAAARHALAMAEAILEDLG
ncbi:hypothetical protein [Acidocella sp. KAb 2-4]|uniref:hypothetical protein n=1 Tax=Acidocella sp. KAb 2-4 TaxID=2885158 RepID=UPI001D08D71C|nr:hypothetical protein [Acidocella sp. KAb 2-4]MCB5945933.1 hypothetical protein [Acidocella sp. KAb 2-4]